MLQNGYKSQENVYDLVYVWWGVTVKNEWLDMYVVFPQSNFSKTVKTSSPKWSASGLELFVVNNGADAPP